MDVSLAPKLIAAAVAGSILTGLHAQSSSENVINVKLEWIRVVGSKKSIESITLRTLKDRPTTTDDAGRKIEVIPTQEPEGVIRVNLKVTNQRSTEGSENLDTEVTVTNGETVTVMGKTRKEGSSHNECLLFVTATKA